MTHGPGPIPYFACSDGWRHPTAKVHRSVYLGARTFIGPGAVVEADCHIAEGCGISDMSFIGKGSTLGPDCRLSFWSKIGPNCVLNQNVIIGRNSRLEGSNTLGAACRIGECCFLGSGAKLGEQCELFSHSRLADNANFQTTPAHFTGSRAVVSHAGRRQIVIGCELRTVDDWLANYEAIGRAHGYSEEEIQEYRKLIQWVSEADLLVFPPDEVQTS